MYARIGIIRNIGKQNKVLKRTFLPETRDTAREIEKRTKF